jgi:hypothetical protein
VTRENLCALLALLCLLSLAACVYALVTGSDGRLAFGILVIAATAFGIAERGAGLPMGTMKRNDKYFN